MAWHPAATPEPYSPHLICGVTLDQIDILHRLLRTITAHGDMVAVCSGEALDQHSVSTLGEAIFDAAREVREIVDRIDAQRL